MAINHSVALYQLCQDTFSRPIIITPNVSQPGQPAYTRRGIYSSRDVMVQTDSGLAVVSDQETIVDIREDEFDVLPQQGDLLEIQLYNGITVGVGIYEITDTGHNGGGETTLNIRKFSDTLDGVGKRSGWQLK